MTNELTTLCKSIGEAINPDELTLTPEATLQAVRNLKKLFLQQWEATSDLFEENRKLKTQVKRLKTINKKLKEKS